LVVCFGMIRESLGLLVVRERDSIARTVSGTAAFRVKARVLVLR
jgi:hypothetical protein